MVKWISIKGFDGYYVSNNGTIKSTLNGKEHIMKLKLNRKKNGYYIVGLRKDGKTYWKTVHRLVAEAFLPNLNNYEEVNHKDENKLNNNVDNIEWCSRKHNMEMWSKNNFVHKPVKHHEEVYQYDNDWNLIKKWKNCSKAGEVLGIARQAISRACVHGYRAGKYRWSHKPVTN